MGYFVDQADFLVCRLTLAASVLQGSAGMLCSACCLPTACPLPLRSSTWLTPQLPLVQVEMDIAHHRTLLDLHHKVNMRERIVGW